MSAKYEFIDSEKANYPLVRMFVWMSVSGSGFYEWRDRPASVTATRRAWLATQVKIEFEESDGTYGYRRVHSALARRGVHTGPELVRSLMRQLDLVACQPRPWRTTTAADADPAAIPDLVRRDFTAPAPGVKLVGDITYIHTWEGWLYLATVIDCHTKAVVGWSMADHFRTPLIDAAITMAAGNIDLEPGCIFHSDRGGNGEFNWSSQHLDLEVWEWDDGRVGPRLRRGGRGCGHQGGRRWRCGSSASGSGRRSVVG
ncbi:IS3 family transposase [Pseudofrankia sp. BMG5.36]|uniref:IS3 family transposase n=1 Tax=Pseudofrankia sp. BMG5.36 TaxID=1834512 RepID=UPI0009F46DB4|nr:IS3 family transposase [Pseudofrankia sp. BMG5.36]